MSKVDTIRAKVVEVLKGVPEADRSVPATPELRAKVACWCGALGGQPCLNSKGEPQGFQHASRGMKREVVVAIAKASGIPWPR